MFGVEPDVRRHDRYIEVRSRAGHIGDADPFALQVGDGSDALMHEQLEAPGMHTCNYRDRHIGIKATDGPWRKHETEVDLALSESLSELWT